MQMPKPPNFMELSSIVGTELRTALNEDSVAMEIQHLPLVCAQLDGQLIGLRISCWKRVGAVE
jgi:hypothetical protein